MEKAPTQAVLDVEGVGYGLAISLMTYQQLQEIGSRSYLHIYTFAKTVWNYLHFLPLMNVQCLSC